MFSGEYTDTVIEHFMCPRNVGLIKDINGESNIGDPGCGDSINMYIRVKDDIVEDISFLVYGCPASVATSSIASELIKGKSLEEALKITDDDVIDALGGLPEHKKHCSNLGITAFRAAVEDYYKRINVNYNKAQ